MHDVKKTGSKLGIHYNLESMGVNNVENLVWGLECYEQYNRIIQLTGALTGILLGPSIFDNKKSSSLRLKHLKVFLASLYIFVLGFSIMWISRASDITTIENAVDNTVDINAFTDHDLETFVHNKLGVSNEVLRDILVVFKNDKNLLENFVRVERPSEILTMKLKLLNI